MHILVICVRWDSVSYQATVASHLEPSLQILPVLTTPPVPVCAWELEEMCSLPKEEGLAHWLLQHLDIHNFPWPSVNYLWVSLLILEGDIPCGRSQEMTNTCCYSRSTAVSKLQGLRMGCEQELLCVHCGIYQRDIKKY